MKHAKKVIWTFIILALIIVVLTVGAVKYVKQRYRGLTYQAYTSNETIDVLDNPYMGFYTMYGFILQDEPDNLQYISSRIPKDFSNELSLVEINLLRYADSDLSDMALQQLEAILSGWSESGRQMILRFLYDWDGNNLETEPDNIDRVLRHMEQVAPIVNEYADHVYILQGLFVGSYGEMTNSPFLGSENVQLMINKWAQLTDPSIFLAVRTPSYWRMINNSYYAPLTFPAFNGSLMSRLSLYNDGMLGSETDLGTYNTVTPAVLTSPSERRSRNSELVFQSDLCDYVPNGGEVVIDNVYNDLDNAIQDLRTMHVSYLNGAYDSSVLDKWRNTTYQSTDCFNGVDGYTYIETHLGYRYVLRSSAITFDTWHDDSALLTCMLENVGFASCLRPLNASFILENTASQITLSIPIDIDLRLLSSDEIHRLTADLPVRTIVPSNYRVYLKIVDPVSELQIQLATDLEQTDYGYLLGEFDLTSLQ